MTIDKSGVTLDNLTIVKTSGSWAVALKITQPTVTVKNSFISSSISGGDPLYILSTGNTLSNVVVGNYGNLGGGVKLASNAGATFNNSIINNTYGYALSVGSGATANLTNCMIIASGVINPYTILFIDATSTANTTNYFIQGSPFAGFHSITSGGGVWNSTNDILNEYPYITRTKENMGYISFFTDDTGIAYFKTLADYAMSTYGIPMTMFVSNTQSLSSADKANLQALYKSGHEIATHTRDHNSLSSLNAIRVTYSGAGSSMAFVVSGSGTSLSVTGTADTHGPIDLTASPSDTLGELCTTIGTWPSFTCAVITNIQTYTPANSLKDASTSLPTSVATNIPFDDDTGPTNRYFSHEITGSINDLETALHEDPACASYTVKTLAFPWSEASTQVVSWIKANTNLIGLRNNDSGNTNERWLGKINVYDAISYITDIRGSGYSGLSLTDQESRIRKSARTITYYASNGYWASFRSHNITELTLQEFTWFLDELAKYTSRDNIQINSFGYFIDQIRNSGAWTDADSDGVYERTFSADSDFRLNYLSQAINNGITVSGLTSDFLGNSVPQGSAPDIGAYEFLLPSSPSSLTQYKINGVTTISTGDSTDGTSVSLKFSMPSSNSSDSLTPQIEVREVGTDFTNTVTNSGDAVTYSGSSVTGVVNVTGLVSGKNYHWQARVSNSAGQGSWASYGGNSESSSDFSIDVSKSVNRSVGAPSCSNTAPSTAPWLYSAVAQDSKSILLSFTEAGKPVDKYILEYGTKPGVYNFGSDNIGGNGTKSYLVKSLSPNTIYYFRIRAGNGCATGTWSNEISAATGSLNNKHNLNIVSSELTTVPKETNQQKTEVSNGYEVKVKVIDTNKKPIEGAKVTLHSNPQTAKTDKNGIASFKNVEAGEHKVLIAYNNLTGEQTVNLTGDVKEFDLNVTIQPKNTFLSPLAIGLLGLSVLIIVILGIILIKKKH